MATAVPTAKAAKTAVVTKYISWVTLALMTTSSVASLRAAPTMAVYGLACVFLYLLPALLFLLPTAFVAAELASGWAGGVYKWVGEGLSQPLGFLAVWCQFAMTIFYYPSLLAYVASTFAYIIHPSLATNGLYVAIVIIVIYWAGVYVSSQGTKTVAGLSSMGLIIGTLIPGVLLVVLGIVFLAQGNSSAAPMDSSHLLPAWTGLASLVLIVNNFLSYAGMEMNAVHVSSLKDPGREYPKAMALAVALVLAIFIIPAVVISWVVPSKNLSLTAGVMQAFDGFFNHFGIGFLTPVLGVMLVAAALGGMLTWLAGPSKGLLLIGRTEGYLPPILTRVNRHGVQQNMLMAQGVVTTILALLYAFIPDVSSAYWILSVITTQVYLIMYVLMFVAAIRLRRKQPDHPRGYRAPALIALCGLGTVSSVAAFLIGFVPPSQYGSGNALSYVLLIGLGMGIVGLLIPYLFFRFRKPSWKTEVPGEVQP
ncbi:APC family permease [Nocardia mexicana]|uniref:Putative glutamate/gamma-aminobutyrate antiporter n=1 Tax=Nocardia mexicana TaxID=279262 RepID=A0A370GZS0_9NOCA|nr:APC family permease [Nocardia mexicana]RDI47293.1 putative glutamate/gamma-aminobutyrate antiporter [Nocardia mexicana]